MTTITYRILGSGSDYCNELSINSSFDKSGYPMVE